MSQLTSVILEVTNANRSVDDIGIEQLIDAQLIERLLQRHGTVSLRRRKLPMSALVWLLVLMSICRRVSMATLVTRLGLDDPPTESAVGKSRARLGVAPVRELFAITAEAWCDELDQPTHGMTVVAIDATTIRLADTAAIEWAFGRPSGSGVPAAWPQLRLLTAYSPSSRIIRAATYGRYNVGEHTLIRKLLRRLPAGSLLLLDAGFASFGLLHTIVAAGHHFLCRVRGTVATGGTLVRKHANGDETIRLALSQQARASYPNAPKTITARRVEWVARGHADKRLLTSLPPEMLDRDAVIAEYVRRWEVELAFDEIKEHQLEQVVTLRSRTVRGVRQELWALLLGYNCVRTAMARAARQAGDVTPADLSFRRSMLEVRQFVEWAWVSPPGALPKLYAALLEDLATFRLAPRTNRSNPRESKVRRVKYARKVPKRHTHP